MTKHGTITIVLSMLLSSLFSLAAVSKFTDHITRVVTSFLAAHVAMLTKILGPGLGKDAGRAEADGISVAVATLDKVLTKYVPADVAVKIEAELQTIASAAEHALEPAVGA